MEPWLLSRTTLHSWQMLATKLADMTTAEGGRVQYWVLSDDPRFQVGGEPPQGVNWTTLADGFSEAPGAMKESCSLFILIKLIPARGERPAIRYVIAIDSTPYMGTLEEFTRTLLLITALGVILVAVLGFMIARFGMRPVNTMSEQAHKLAPGDHGQRLDTTTLPDELQTLAEAFNGVLERRGSGWRQLESFNADVAHELRTPLTNLIGQTQLGLSRERSVSELEDLLESNLEELARMTSIVNDMLFLSHAQSRGTRHPAYRGIAARGGVENRRICRTLLCREEPHYQRGRRYHCLYRPSAVPPFTGKPAGKWGSPCKTEYHGHRFHSPAA